MGWKQNGRPELRRLSHMDTSILLSSVNSLHDGLSGDKRLRGARLLNKRHVPPGVSRAQFVFGDGLLSRHDRLDEMHTAVGGGGMEHRNHLRALDRRKSGER